MLSLDIFKKWEDETNGEYRQFTKCTREVRALACYRAIVSVTQHLACQHLPWILFQVLHPGDEPSGLLRTHDKNFVQSITDRNTENFPVEVQNFVAFRQGNLETYNRKRVKWIKDEPPTDKKLQKLDEEIITRIYHFDMDASTMAQTIGKPGIGLCYYTLYKNFDCEELKAILDAPAPKGSSKQDAMRRACEYVENLGGELRRDQDVIRSFCESVRHIRLPDDLEQGKAKPTAAPDLFFSGAGASRGKLHGGGGGGGWAKSNVCRK